MLSGKKDPRSVYFYANMLFKLLERQLVHYNVVKNAYDYRISMCTDPEEEFICCMNNGLILAVNEDPEFERYYILASLRFPPRRCESYFYLWLCTNKEKYLELAYKSCEPCKSRMPKDESLYSENGLIAKKYFEVKNSCQL
jgi:hypothetical protein